MNELDALGIFGKAILATKWDPTVDKNVYATSVPYQGSRYTVRVNISGGRSMARITSVQGFGKPLEYITGVQANKRHTRMMIQSVQEFLRG